MKNRIPAVVAAGDQKASRAIYGESKSFLLLENLPLVVHVVLMLQEVEEISEVWVVGRICRLELIFQKEEVIRRLIKPLHLLDQFSNLYENVWQGYRHLLPGAPPGGRDPQTEEEKNQWVFYLSGDLPFAMAEEVSEMISKGISLRASYVLGIVRQETLRIFHPDQNEGAGVNPACFSIREGRFRQNNFHLVQPGRLPNRRYIEELYENRHQLRLHDGIRLAIRILTKEEGSLRLLYYYALVHLSGFADRHGWIHFADQIRKMIPMESVEQALSQLLRAPLRFCITTLGGAAVDIDTESDFEIARKNFHSWKKMQCSSNQMFQTALPEAPVPVCSHRRPDS